MDPLEIERKHARLYPRKLRLDDRLLLTIICTNIILLLLFRKRQKNPTICCTAFNQLKCPLTGCGLHVLFNMLIQCFQIKHLCSCIIQHNE